MAKKEEEEGWDDDKSSCFQVGEVTFFVFFFGCSMHRQAAKRTKVNFPNRFYRFSTAFFPKKKSPDRSKSRKSAKRHS